MTSDPFEVLIAHNHWATRQVLELCRGLTREQFHRPFPIGPGEHGGLHATTTHIVSAMGRWADRISGKPVRKSLERARNGNEADSDARDRTPEELLEFLERATAELAAVVNENAARSLDELVTVGLGSAKYTFTRGAAIVHALTHGHYHRAQCLNMLRQLGVPGISDKLPELDVVDWQYEAEGAGVAG